MVCNPNYHPNTQAVKVDYSLAGDWVAQTTLAPPLNSPPVFFTVCTCNCCTVQCGTGDRPAPARRDSNPISTQVAEHSHLFTPALKHYKHSAVVSEARTTRLTALTDGGCCSKRPAAIRLVCCLALSYVYVTCVNITGRRTNELSNRNTSSW